MKKEGLHEILKGAGIVGETLTEFFVRTGLSTIRREILDGIRCNKTPIDTIFGPDTVPEPQTISHIKDAKVVGRKEAI